MPSRIVKLTVLLLAIASPLAASELKKWGQVLPEHLSMTSYPRDTSANAVKLFDVGHLELSVSDRFNLYYTRHFQIKILKEGGKNQADVIVPYWHEDTVNKIKAQTILPNGKKIKVKKIFSEEYKENYKVKKLTFPQVEIGSILELEYKIHSQYITNLEPWTFQSELPEIESAISLKIAPGFRYHALVQNDLQKRIKKSTESYLNPKYSNQLTKFIWSGEHMPAVRSEPYISSLQNYRARLLFTLDSYKDTYTNIKWAKDIPTLTKELLESPIYGSFLKPSGDAKKLASELTAGLLSDEAKIRKLYNYVRDEFEDESYSGRYPRKKQDEILEQRKASASEQNLLLMALITAAGIDAWPVLVSTRDHGRVDSTLPFLDQYNRSLILVKTENDNMVLDASDKFTVFGSLPLNSQFDHGLMLDKKLPKHIVNSDAGLKSQESWQLETHVDNGGNISSNVSLSSTGYASRNRNRQLDGSDDVKDFLTSQIAADLEDVEITNHDAKLIAAAQDTFATAFEFKVPEYCEVIDNEIFIRPVLFERYERNPFRSAQREFPVEFGYPWKTTEINMIYLPDGYEIAESPSNLRINNKFFSYRRMVTKLGNRVSYVRMLEISTQYVSPADYDQLRSEFARIVDADQEQLVFRMSGI